MSAPHSSARLADLLTLPPYQVGAARAWDVAARQMWSVETLPMAGVNRRRGFNFPSDEEAIKEAEAAEHASQARAEAQAITLAQNAGQRPVNRSGTYIA